MSGGRTSLMVGAQSRAARRVADEVGQVTGVLMDVAKGLEAAGQGVGVPSYDFAVDLKALVDAAQGMAEAVQGMAEAVRLMKVKDVEEVSGRLGKVAMTYARFEQDGNQTLVAATPKPAALRLGQGS